MKTELKQVNGFGFFTQNVNCDNNNNNNNNNNTTLRSSVLIFMLNIYTSEFK